MVDIVFEPIAKFLSIHAKFIIGVIVNTLLIRRVSAIIDISVDVEYGTSSEKLDRACQILRETAEKMILQKVYTPLLKT